MMLMSIPYRVRMVDGMVVEINDGAGAELNDGGIAFDCSWSLVIAAALASSRDFW